MTIAELRTIFYDDRPGHEALFAGAGEVVIESPVMLTT